MRPVHLLLLAILTGCAGDGFSAADYDDCVAKYASSAATPLGVRGGVMQCRTAFSDTASSSQKKTAHCILTKLPGTKNDQGVRAAWVGCQRGQ